MPRCLMPVSVADAHRWDDTGSDRIRQVADAGPNEPHAPSI